MNPTKNETKHAPPARHSPPATPEQLELFDSSAYLSGARPAAAEARPSRDDLPASPHTQLSLFETGSYFEPVSAGEIKGLDPIVRELDEIVHWLEHAEEYERHGSRLEPGVLLMGPPGTGKTMAARYIATQTNALLVSAREFAATSDGLGPPQVSELFARARAARTSRRQPIVIFWDEFHAPARATAQGPRERAVVEQLLSELDGIAGKTSGILLLACSNDYNIDDALLRAGRMGRQIRFCPPSRAGQIELLRHYVRQRVGSEELDSFDFDSVADLFDPSDTAALIEELVQDGWRLATARAIDNHEAPRLTQSDVLEAVLKRSLGYALPQFDTSERRIQTAVHEVGHALVALAYGIGVRAISIRPNGEWLGVTKTRCPDIPTVAGQLRNIRIAFGGLVAERVCGLEQSLGCAGDTRMATAAAVSLVECYAASELPNLNPSALSWGPHSSRTVVSQQTLAEIDEAAQEMLADAYIDVQEILSQIGPEKIQAISEQVEASEIMCEREFSQVVWSIAGDPAVHLSPRPTFAPSSEWKPICGPKMGVTEDGLPEVA